MVKKRKRPTSELRRLIPYVLPFKWHLLLMLAGAVGGQVCATLIPMGIKRVIDSVLVDHQMASMVPLILLVGGLGLAQGVFFGMRRFVLAKASSTMEMRLRTDLYAHLQRLSLNTHAEWQTGQLLSRAMSDSNQVFRDFVSYAVVYFITNIVTLVLAGALMLSLSVKLTLVVALPMLPLSWLTREFRIRYRVASRLTQDRRGDLGTTIEEAALGARVIAAFSRQHETLDAFARQAQTARETAVAGSRIVGRFKALLDFIPNIMMAGVLCVGAWSVSDGSLTVGGLVAFFSLLLVLSGPVQSFGEILMVTHEAASGAQRVFEVLDIDPDIKESPHAVSIKRVAGGIVFRDVIFSYDGNDRSLFDGLNLVVEPGETVAIAGRTGSGKTTLCALVSRLIDPTSGLIEFDGTDIRNLKLWSLRQNVGVAFEEALLFSASVRENVLLGHPDATDEDIEAALSLAQAGFVMDLPYGLDTRIGEQGLNLSGGQRQRLALARAVIGRPPVLVLDDPLSALDVNTEALVEAALAQVMKETTTIMSVHRPSTAALADRVAFLEDGKIVTIGKHEELLMTVPTYRDLLGETTPVTR